LRRKNKDVLWHQAFKDFSPVTARALSPCSRTEYSAE